MWATYATANRGACWDHGSDAILARPSQGVCDVHFAKVVLLGNLCAGKSSLADSLVLGRPATRAADDWAVPSRVLPTTAPLVSTCAAGGSVAAKGSARKKLVVNICDIAGQRVYRASHLLFTTDEALFLHVFKSDASEDDAVMVVLEWVEAVQQAAPSAVMWTRFDLMFGSQWEEIGSSVPTTGTEITNAMLAAALQTKLEFAKADYDTLSISNVSRSSYVKARASYFQPVDGGAAAKREVCQAVLSRVTQEI